MNFLEMKDVCVFYLVFLGFFLKWMLLLSKKRDVRLVWVK